MRNIEIRHLRYFVAVAEAGSVMAGARIVGIVQPALSRQIRELEDSIGAQLLVRTSKGVQLTVAGQGFLQDAKRLLSDLQNSQQQALRASRGEIGELRLGVLPNYLTLPLFAKALQAFRIACPEVKVSVEPMLSSAQAVAIANKQLDGGIMAWRTSDAPHLNGVLLLRERFVLALPTVSIDPKRLPNQLADLSGHSFIWFDPTRSSTHHRFLMDQFGQVGFKPMVTQVGADIPTLMGLVAAGMGCAFVPESVAEVCPPSVTLIALEEVSKPFDVEFAYDEQQVTPVTSQFIAALGNNGL